MCLRITDNSVDFKDGKIVFYKILCLRNEKLTSPYWGDYVWSPGVNKSNRNVDDPALPTLAEEALRREVSFGIHVFLDKDNINALCESIKGDAWSVSGCYKIVPVTCYEKDLVAVGTWGNVPPDRSAVFTEVLLLREDYDAAIK